MLLANHLKPNWHQLAAKPTRAGRGTHAHAPQGGRAFREEYLWQLSVADLLQANLVALGGVPGTPGLYGYLECVELDAAAGPSSAELGLSKCQAVLGPLLEMTEEQVAEAYSFSKMVPVDELGPGGGGYQRMQFVEFCELLVRLAHMRFRSEAGLPFPDKLTRTFEILFTLTGAEVTSLEPEKEISSASDYASDED